MGHGKELSLGRIISNMEVYRKTALAVSAARIEVQTWQFLFTGYGCAFTAIHSGASGELTIFSNEYQLVAVTWSQNRR